MEDSLAGDGILNSFFIQILDVELGHYFALNLTADSILELAGVHELEFPSNS